MSEKSNVEKQIEEVDNNFKVFQELMRNDKIPKEKFGLFALLKNGEIKGYYINELDATEAAKMAFNDNLYSIQHVSNNVVNMGYFSHAFL